MFQPDPNQDGLMGVQKHHVSGLLYIGNFAAAEDEIAKAPNSNSTPAIAIVCCTTGYIKGPKKLRESVEKTKNQGKLKHLDIGFGDLAPDHPERIHDQVLNDLFQQAYEFIDDAIKNNIPVLVHCDQGSTRSATLITAYLMRSANISLAEAEIRVKKARGFTEAYDITTHQQSLVSYANIDNFRNFLVRCEKEFNRPVVAAPSSATTSMQLPSAQSAGETLLVEAINNSPPISSASPKLLAKVFQAENSLDTIVKTMANRHENKETAYNNIYNLFHNLYSEHNEPIIDKLNVSELKTKLSDMTQLFHTLLQHKDKIDLHKHSTLDLFLFKDKSSSWQFLIEMIRKNALSLISRIDILMFRDRCPNEEIVKYLTTQQNNPLFCLHRGNHWYEKFGVTNAVKYINSLIAEREKKSPQLSQV